MGRKPRIEFPGAFYHVIARGNHRQAIFHEDADRHHYLNRLERGRRRHGFAIYAYVLMTNHVHLLLETATTPLSRIMQGLQSTYARYYNWRYEAVGHLFQARYRALLCDRDAYLLELVRYLHLNPARIAPPLDPWRFRWSSHGAYMGEASPVAVETSLILRQFGSRVGPARHAYLQFLADGLAKGHQSKYYEALDQRFVGNEEFVRKVARQSGSDCHLEAPRSGVPFGLLVQAVAQVHGLDPARLLGPDRRRDGVRARAMLVYLAREWGGLEIQALGHRLRRDAATVSRLYARYADGRDPTGEARVVRWLGQ